MTTVGGIAARIDDGSGDDGSDSTGKLARGVTAGTEVASGCVAPERGEARSTKGGLAATGTWFTGADAGKGELSPPWVSLRTAEPATPAGTTRA
jgi:hypothetical protein